ncbi:MAG: phospholipase D-like domain-containing protein [Chloroflexota bacterium]|nr:phospholipase D-like domain-containing protein [Dehalococcoidia bacterium]MDW8254796.1 phospholipase D-like domain-containing protein [Chloroflexota bacterium]
MGRRLVAFSVALALLALCFCVVVAVALPRLLEQAGALGAAPVRSGSWYEVWFTVPGSPDRPAERRNSIDERLVAFIDGAQRRLDVAVYDFDLANVAEALVRAKQRGVEVRFVTDADTVGSDNRAIQTAIARVRQGGIPIVTDNRGAIMHHKFVVRDSDAVWTGSYNFTANDTFRHNNNVLVIFSPKVAENYEAEFEKMFARRQFGPSKPAGVPNPRVVIDGSAIETLFAPQDKVAERVVARVREARTRIVFLAFQFTSDSIGDAMIARARNGVKVAGVVERTGSETQFAEFRKLQAAGIEVYQDGNPYIMHHKVIVIDDRIVMLGSYNFSENADRNNDENLLIIEDRGLAQRYLEEFDRVREAARRAEQR